MCRDKKLAASRALDPFHLTPMQYANLVSLSEYVPSISLFLSLSRRFSPSLAGVVQSLVSLSHTMSLVGRAVSISLSGAHGTV